ncbi:pentapeptide repeat-containing protein [Mycobacterium szulgai]|nr:pentapeptide repeat-containing protein [Mycobacterium szulgai]
MTRQHRLRLTQPVAKRRPLAAVLWSYLAKPFTSSGWSKVLPLATAVAAVGGLVFSGSNLQQIKHQAVLSEQSQNADRFREAVGQIGEGKIDVQLGGIYSLEQLARDAPPYHRVVFEVMGAYLRTNATQRECPRDSKCSSDWKCPEQDRLPTVIQAALTVIGRREMPRDDGDDEIDLNKTCLRRATLDGARLSKANLRGADLRDADLDGANLSGRRTDLSNTDLRYTYLDNTNLSEANLSWTDFSEAHFGRTNLSGADLKGADLRGTDLAHTNLSNIYYEKSTVWPEHFVPPPSRPQE